MLTLTQSEIKDIREYSQKMYEHHERQRGKNKKVGNQSDLYYMVQGYSGELAVYKFFGLPYHFTIHEHRYIPDINLLFQGKELIFDIKTSEKQMLTVPVWQINDPKWKVIQGYIKVWQKDDVFVIMGAISKPKFLKYATVEPIIIDTFCLRVESKLTPIGRFNLVL